MTKQKRKMARRITSTAISVRGDRAYVDLINAYAKLNKMSVAELVRKAIDAQYGQALDSLKSFHASTTPQTEQI